MSPARFFANATVAPKKGQKSAYCSRRHRYPRAGDGDAQPLRRGDGLVEQQLGGEGGGDRNQVEQAGDAADFAVPDQLVEQADGADRDEYRHPDQSDDEFAGPADIAGFIGDGAEGAGGGAGGALEGAAGE